MDKMSAIEDLYFILEKNVVEIAKELSVTKQYVSKVLSTEFKDRYLQEKESRKERNKENRNRSKAKSITEKRKEIAENDNVINLKRQHEIDTMCMSRSGRLSTESAVYLNINAYNVKGNNLVYNESIGSKPKDLPSKFSLSINVYK